MSIAIQIVIETWNVLTDSAIFLLVGFFLAGLIKSFLPVEKVKARLGGSGAGPVLKASLVGIPLPLCSCSVLPAAISLRKMGASRGAVSSFLISTPETGVDSVAISYALLDPLMTLFRPVAAFITAITAGTLEVVFGKGDAENDTVAVDNIDERTACGGACGDDRSAPVAGQDEGKLSSSLRYAFFDLMDDLAWWLLIGIFFAGVVSALLPEDFFSNSMMDKNYIAMPVMLLLGVPMYICATSSTPLAAAMIIKGLSPGAALVFLLAGPATNIASIMAIKEFLGGRSLLIYLSAISFSAILLGVTLDYIYLASGVEPSVTMGQAAELFPVWLETMAAILFSVFMARSIYVTKVRKTLSHIYAA